jgi:hypothetical protein
MKANKTIFRIASGICIVYLFLAMLSVDFDLSPKYYYYCSEDKAMPCNNHLYDEFCYIKGEECLSETIPQGSYIGDKEGYEKIANNPLITNGANFMFIVSGLALLSNYLYFRFFKND